MNLRWHRMTDYNHALVNENDEIVASLTTTGNDLWFYGQRAFVSLDGAKRAVEAEVRPDSPPVEPEVAP